MLKTNLVYIRMFRHESRLVGEDEYYLTTIESAVVFVQNMTTGDLKLETEEEYMFENYRWDPPTEEETK